jgi:haloalkane dehalogenase
MPDLDATGILQGFRSDAGEDRVIGKNLFVEPQHRRPTLTWPRQIPIEGEPADVTEIVDAYAQWLSTADLPKLFISAEPGALVAGAVAEYCRSWPNLTEVTVAGSHFIQEDSPHEIGEAIADWVATLGQ